MTEQDLIDAGYKKYSNVLNNANYSYQRKVYRDNTLLFFINVHIYDFTIYESHMHDLGIQMSADIGVYLPDETYINIDITSCHDKDLQEVEQWFVDAFDRLECVPDIHND